MLQTADNIDHLFGQGLDLANSSDSRALAAQLVGEGQRVLEIAPPNERVSRLLQQRGCHVVAVEGDRSVCTALRKHGTSVIFGDVEQLHLGQQLRWRKFDALWLGAILEEIADPLRMLQKLLPLVSEDGCMLVSFNNMAHASTRLALLDGVFSPQLGRKARFFTLEAAESLLTAAGLSIDTIERVSLDPMIDPATGELRWDRTAIPPAIQMVIDRDPEAAVARYVIKATPDPSRRPESAQAFGEGASRVRSLLSEAEWQLLEAPEREAREAMATAEARVIELESALQLIEQQQAKKLHQVEQDFAQQRATLQSEYEQTISTLQSESAQTITALRSEAQQSRTEATQLAGRLESVELALRQRDDELALQLSQVHSLHQQLHQQRDEAAATTAALQGTIDDQSERLSRQQDEFEATKALLQRGIDEQAEQLSTAAIKLGKRDRLIDEQAEQLQRLQQRRAQAEAALRAESEQWQVRIAEAETLVEQKQQLVARHQQHLDGLEQQLQQARDEQQRLMQLGEQRAEAIDEQEAVLMQLGDSVREATCELAETKQQLQTQIVELEQDLDDRHRQMQQRDQEAAALRDRLSSLETATDDVSMGLQERTMELERELQRLRESWPVKVAARFDRAKETLLPRGSKRRALCERLLGGGSTEAPSANTTALARRR